VYILQKRIRPAPTLKSLPFIFKKIEDHPGKVKYSNKNQQPKLTISQTFWFFNSIFGGFSIPAFPDGETLFWGDFPLSAGTVDLKKLIFRN